MLSLIYKRAYEKIINIEHFVTTSSNIKKGIFKNNIKISKIKDIPCDYPQYEIKFFNNFLVENETIMMLLICSLIFILFYSPFIWKDWNDNILITFFFILYFIHVYMIFSQ